MIWFLFILAAFIFCARDFTGNGVSTLGSLYLQQARGYNTWQTGLALSCVFAASAISNPLFGHLSDRGRMRWAGGVLVMAALVVAIFPHVPPAGIIPTFLVYGFFFMASYPIVEAALMESVPPEVRGRVFGLWITIGGLLGNLAHWLSGSWVESMGSKSTAAANYYGVYAWMAVLILVSLLGLPCLNAIRKREHLEPALPKP